MNPLNNKAQRASFRLEAGEKNEAIAIRKAMTSPRTHKYNNTMPTAPNKGFINALKKKPITNSIFTFREIRYAKDPR